MKISKDNIDEYYDKVNKKIDKYFGKSVNPFSLKRYFKKDGYGIKRFIDREGLDEVENIQKVIIDCIDDRVAMEESGILTFESFMNDTSSFNIYFEDINYERTISDFYKISLGHIEKIKNNLIKITGVGDFKKILVLDTKSFGNVVEQLCEKMYLKINGDTIEYNILDFSLNMKGKIDKDKFIKNTYYDILNNKDGGVNVINSIINLETSSEFKYVGEKNGIYIFEKS
jgi:hypothetical protein